MSKLFAKWQVRTDVLSIIACRGEARTAAGTHVRQAGGRYSSRRVPRAGDTLVYFASYTGTKQGKSREDSAL